MGREREREREAELLKTLRQRLRRLSPILFLSLNPIDVPPVNIVKTSQAMSSSKFLFFGTSLFRTPKTLTSFPPLHLTKPLFFFSTRSFSLSSTATDTSSPSSLPRVPHPWPEWVSFVDKLKSKGYFIETPRKSKEEEEESSRISSSSSSSGHYDMGNDVASSSSIDEQIYRDMNLLKDPCLSFARDRFDIFKSLSMEDLQKVVEIGCPNILRKVVNSAKRLRVHVRLDESDVCSVCTFRGSCDRAYVILKDSEAAARTVDIVRILLSYALDPLVISGGQKPPGREIIESSVRNLLSELIELSDSSPDPSLPKPVVVAPKSKKQSQDFLDGELSKYAGFEVEMKRGDWMCPKCNFVNFARNAQCLKCKEEKPEQVNTSDIEMKKGDWICPKCSFMNFSRNRECLKCKAEGPKRVGVDEVEMKKGDWICPECSFMNFASNVKCLKCREPRPKRELNPGEWECPSCDFLNYRRNRVCKKCQCEKPRNAVSEYEEQLWKSSY